MNVRFFFTTFATLFIRKQVCIWTLPNAFLMHIAFILIGSESKN